MNIDQNIAEFERAIGPLFAPHRREIELLKSKLMDKRRRHQNRNELQRQLIRMVTTQLRHELAA